MWLLGAEEKKMKKAKAKRKRHDMMRLDRCLYERTRFTVWYAYIQGYGKQNDTAHSQRQSRKRRRRYFDDKKWYEIHMQQRLIVNAIQSAGKYARKREPTASRVSGKLGWWNKAKRECFKALMPGLSLPLSLQRTSTVPEWWSKVLRSFEDEIFFRA